MAICERCRSSRNATKTEPLAGQSVRVGPSCTTFPRRNSCCRIASSSAQRLAARPLMVAPDSYLYLYASNAPDHAWYQMNPF